MAEATHLRFRPVDGGPPDWSPHQSGEVQRGHIVGVMLEAAVDASEEGLAPPIPLIYASTSGACN